MALGFCLFAFRCWSRKVNRILRVFGRRRFAVPFFSFLFWPFLRWTFDSCAFSSLFSFGFSSNFLHTCSCSIFALLLPKKYLLPTCHATIRQQIGLVILLFCTSSFSFHITFFTLLYVLAYILCLLSRSRFSLQIWVSGILPAFSHLASKAYL